MSREIYRNPLVLYKYYLVYACQYFGINLCLSIITTYAMYVASIKINYRQFIIHYLHKYRYFIIFKQYKYIVTHNKASVPTFWLDSQAVLQKGQLESSRLVQSSRCS